MAFAYTNSTFFGKKAKQNTKTPFFWQYCIILSAEALLEPQGGNCAVPPLFPVCFYIEAERMCVNFSSSCGNWQTIFPFLSSSSFPANAANRYLDRVDFRFSLSPSRVQNSTSPRHCCTASRKAAKSVWLVSHGLFPPLLRYSVGLHPITLRNTAVK